MTKTCACVLCPRHASDRKADRVLTVLLTVLAVPAFAYVAYLQHAGQLGWRLISFGWALL